ncbi:MAG: CBS domain-containing protein [Planctomycetes bacterium]|nr:CBS domain-containing protein [Planctomycetota bacterium]
MLVSEICTKDVRCCDRNTDLASAARMMWESDCGVIPVVDAENKVIGVVTDRDICIAGATRRQLASEIRVGDVMGATCVTCRPAEDVRSVLAAMAQHSVRRLPVVDDNRKLSGMISISDVIQAARDPREGSKGGISPAEVLHALEAVTRPRTPRKETPAAAAPTTAARR